MAGGLTPTLACVYTTVASYAAFLAGRATHSFYVADLPKVVLETNDSGDMYSSQPSQIAESNKPYFPLPELISGKEAPKTKYTSMVHSAVLSATAGYATLHLFDKEADSSLDDIEEVCHKTDDGHSKCSINGFSEEDIQLAFQEMEEAEPNDEEHLPAGQHLLIDIERVNSAFLDDEVALAKAMVDVVNESKLTLLSYHCHKLLPMGVSCVGVLLESHISFHTWPEAGVITLDLFTCGSGKLIPVLPILKRLFAIPQEGAKDIITEQPRTLWTHKYRGFRNNFLTTDLMEEIQERSSYNLKEEIVSVQTPFQRIDIYDVLESDNDHDYKHYEQLQLGEDEFFTKNPDFYSANRIVFLEGVLQSERDGNAAYHESLVHPALFFHPNPKQVAIIGGGEGATLREVLKHNTVNKVKMMEIDEMMVQVSREYLPDWNDCSDLADSAQWCGDDKRAEMNYVDAFGWFNSRFADDVEIDEEEKFDVLIMDALDPEDDVPFAAMLYNDYDFIKTLYNSLTDNGVIVLQLGEADNYDDPSARFTRGSRRETVIELLEEVGFETMHLYQEGNCGFMAPWTFLVAAKNENVDHRWYLSEALLEVDIHKRTVRTNSGEPALKYFDGTVMKSYHNPHKFSETVFCRDDPVPDSCKTVDEVRPDIPLSDFEVKMSTLGTSSGRGVVTKVDIPKGSTIARSANFKIVHAPTYALELIEEYELNDAFDYLEGYGWETYSHGDLEYYVEPSLFTFVNHGCNGTFNILDWTSFLEWEKTGYLVTEQNVTANDFDVNFDEDAYDVHRSRHIESDSLSYAVAMRDIKAGEEIFSNYVFYASDEKAWKEDVMDLRRWCSGEDVGSITQIEKSK